MPWSITLNFWQQLSRNLGIRSSTPIITWLSPSARIELSGKTLLNAVSKSANYLVENFESEIENEIQITLDNHWQSVVWHLAAVSSELNIWTASKNCFCFLENLVQENNFVVSQDPFGLPEKNLPLDVHNVSLEVRACPDLFLPSQGKFENQIKISEEIYEVSKIDKYIAQAIRDYSINGNYALLIKNYSITSIMLQAFIPALTNYSAVLLDEIPSDSNAIVAEKVSQIIEI